MNYAMRITSLHNPHIQNCVKLRERKERDRQQKLFIEGYRAILQALQTGYPLHELYYCPELFFGSNEKTLLASAQQSGVLLREVAEGPFRKIASRPRPDGLLAIGRQIRRPLNDHQARQVSLLLVAESIEKPANLGAIIRCADGAGADGVIVCDPRTDSFSPDVVLASIGACFTVPILEASPIQTIQWCRAHGIATLAATPQAETLYTDVDLRVPVAIAVGNEQCGLSDAWLAAADLHIKLPMYGQLNSLNVAVAAALLLYEVVRQRRGEGERI
jgi:TrmH family RNA methyltransferase